MPLLGVERWKFRQQYIPVSFCYFAKKFVRIVGNPVIGIKYGFAVLHCFLNFFYCYHDFMFEFLLLLNVKQVLKSAFKLIYPCFHFMNFSIQFILLQQKMGYFSD